MLRHVLSIAAATFVVSVLPVSAAGLAGVRCEDPQVVRAMEDGLRNATENGQSLMSKGVIVERISASKTSHSSSNKLICIVTLKLSGASAKASTLRVRYIYQQFSSGKLTATIAAY